VAPKPDGSIILDDFSQRQNVFMIRIGNKSSLSASINVTVFEANEEPFPLAPLDITANNIDSIRVSLTAAA
jgi:hypothetical protein